MQLRRRLTHSRFVQELRRMDVERIIDEIEQLQEIFEAPDIRPLTASDISAANRRHDEKLAHSPCFSCGKGTGSAAEPSLPYFDLETAVVLNITVLRVTSRNHL
jgi:hypothetical protein